MGDNEASEIIGVATSGIQDLSALLPLLGTQQCENHVYAALQRGFLYGAATPMSIFGSLGLVKAGLLVLLGSIDCSWFRGPTLLRNAGFHPTGAGALLSRVDERRGMSIVEEKVQRMLSRKAISSVTVNLKSWDFWKWNIYLITATTILSAFGLLPYILLIHRTPSKSFKVTWLYPLIRVVSCDLVAVSISMILQIRILEEAYFRIRFLAIDNFLKHEGCTELPDFWNYNQRSRDVLDQLRLHANQKCLPPDVDSKTGEAKSAGLIKEASNRLDYFSSFSLRLGEEKEHFRYQESHGVEYLGAGKYFTSEPLPFLGRRTGRLSDHLQHTPLSTVFQPTVLITTLLLLPAQVVLLLSLCGAVVGYVGCFKVVQGSPESDSVGPLVWLVSEAVLAVIRMALWAWNPSFDDPKPPIAMQKSSKAGPRRVEDVISGISWNLDSATTHDLHAVVVGVGKYGPLNCGLDDLPQCTEDARRVEAYLKDTLRVPSSQVVTLLDRDATKDRILSEIKALAHKETLIGNAPAVMIYISAYTFLDWVQEPCILPHIEGPVADAKDAGDRSISVLGGELEQHLKEISKAKTDNVLVIMDCCFAGTASWLPAALDDKQAIITAPTLKFTISPFLALWTDGMISRSTSDDGRRLEILVQGHADQERFWLQKQGTVLFESSTHIAIASARSRLKSDKDAGKLGLLTTSLLDVLTRSTSLGTMTYGRLMQEVSDRMDPKLPNGHPLAKTFSDEEVQHPVWTGNYENRLLFDGLFARRLERGSSSPVITVCYSDP